MDLIAPVRLNLNFRGRPFDFWGREGWWGMGDFRKKNIPQTDFEGKKFLQGNIWREKMLPWKKIPFMAYNAGKNSYTVVCQEKKFYHQRFRKSKILTQTKFPLPPPPPPPPQKSYGRPLIVRASRIVKVLLLLYYLEEDFWHQNSRWESNSRPSGL